MSVLWFGFEDVHILTKASGFSHSASAGTFRSGYARCAMTMSASSSAISRGPAIASPVTDCWIGAQVSLSALYTSSRYSGIARSGHTGGLYIGTDSVTSSKLALWKCDDSGTFTKLATESSTSLGTGLTKMDMRVTSFGASGRARIYLAGSATAIIDYTGDLTWNSITDLDTVALASGSTAAPKYSELILADEDTRAMSVCTLAPGGAGDANTFDSGTYSDIAESTPFAANDATIISSTTTGQAVQFALNNLPAGSFTVKAVNVTARAIRGSSGITKVKLGIKSGGTIDVDAGHDPGTAWADDITRLMLVNPVTSTAFTQAEIDALQAAVESLT